MWNKQSAIILLMMSCGAEALIGRTQSVGIKGVLTCGNQPASRVLVKLYDDDRGRIDTDDLMAKGYTDSRGYFQLVGHSDEFTTIDPKLNIYTNCEKGLSCTRKITYTIPDAYISSGTKPARILDMGRHNLAVRVKGETIMYKYIFIALTSLFCATEALIGRTQSAGVRGVLMCGNRPASNVLVKLYDNDRGLDRDDLMAKGHTDSSGYFQLVGHTDEFTTIDPKLNIYTDCNDHLPCQRKITFYIPKAYVSQGKQPSRIADIGTVNLAFKRKGESRDCFH
ncbi:unnamed protein product [Anisakis simplex]|uniref:Transthyretin-like family protein n=1 Tax=Anisakis simplex TaxID=6269 RepID=A0A0M3IYV0_ANISI|nr:unnamed protein product [Anisakis simplex]